MTVHYGFDMATVSWSAFTWTEMGDKRWHLRRQRIVLYTITMMTGMAAQVQCAATYCMFKYEFLQNHIEAFSMHQAQVHNNDIVAAGITSMVIPCLVLLLFTVEYFLLVLWPAKLYSPTYNRWKKSLFCIGSVGMLATAIVSTVFVAMNSATITGVDSAVAQQLTSVYFRPPLKYNVWPQNISWIVLLWIAVLCCIVSTAVLVRAVHHDEKYMSCLNIPPDTEIVVEADAVAMEEGQSVEAEKSAKDL